MGKLQIYSGPHSGRMKTFRPFRIAMAANLFDALRFLTDCCLFALQYISFHCTKTRVTNHLSFSNYVWTGEKISPSLWNVTYSKDQVKQRWKRVTYELWYKILTFTPRREKYCIFNWQGASKNLELDHVLFLVVKW